MGTRLIICTIHSNRFRGLRFLAIVLEDWKSLDNAKHVQIIELVIVNLNS